LRTKQKIVNTSKFTAKKLVLRRTTRQNVIRCV